MAGGVCVCGSPQVPRRAPRPTIPLHLINLSPFPPVSGTLPSPSCISIMPPYRIRSSFRSWIGWDRMIIQAFPLDCYCGVNLFIRKFFKHLSPWNCPIGLFQLFLSISPPCLSCLSHPWLVGFLLSHFLTIRTVSA